MSQILDLSVTLTPPPAGADPAALASITLRYDALGLSHFGDLLTDPLSKQEREDLQWYLEEYWQWPYEGFLSRGKQIEALLPQIGKRLYESLFGSKEADRIVQKWLAQPETAGTFQLSLLSELPAVLSLPWELLHSEQGYLALRGRRPVSIVRRLPQSELTRDQTTTFTPPLRILLVTARPEGAGFVDPRSIARELLDEVQPAINTGTIAVEFLRPPTLTALQERLRDTKRPAVHILHFDGHGIFMNGRGGQATDPHLLHGGGQGMLAFETKEGTLDLVKAEHLAQTLLDSGVQLAVLTACQSAMGDASDVFSSIAARLIRGGIKAVSAMSASVLVVSAARYTEAFYKELAKGASVALAQERARQSLYTNPRRHVLSRVRSEEGTPVVLQDWWLPHLYQQMPLLLQPTGKKGTQRKEIAQEARPVLNVAMPAAPRYGFSGRSRELWQLERALLQKKLVVIHSFGGIGKTALAREAADWFTRTHLYEGACFVSFEQGGDASTLLSSLGSYLNVYDGDYNPGKVKAALARLQPVLRTTKLLVIADNLESILAQGETPLEPGDRAQLWETLLALAGMGAGVILTSRDPSFGDGRLAPGQHTRHFPLLGLRPDDAYELACHILEDLGIERSRAPYAELHALLAQLDHHPLAIQLVLPALRDRSLASIRDDFAMLLPTFVDDTTAGHNRSLLASLDYSLRRFPQEQRVLLARLAVFEGGAHEQNLPTITQIPQDTWATLRLALEQAALLVAEQVHEEITSPFLHFHPILVPFLRQQAADQEDEGQRLRYASCYADLLSFLKDAVYQRPEPVYTLVRRELPNLRAALAILLRAGDLEAASSMADTLTGFLADLGLLRERDRLRQRMDQILAAVPASEELTLAAYLHEIGRAEDERRSGKIQAAFARLTQLLARIKALPEGTDIGPGSISHVRALHELGNCLEKAGQYPAAQEQFRAALALLDALLVQEPENRDGRANHANVLRDLGNVHRDQGQYTQAQTCYEQALQEHRAVQDTINEAATLGQLGTLALRQRDFIRARLYYQQALQQFQAMGIPEEQAIIWHQLGNSAQLQHSWPEAEHCYRESLTLAERVGNAAFAASACNQLAIVAENSDRPVEAESWYRGALERIERVDAGGLDHAKYLSDLANLLVNEVRSGRTGRSRLAEARFYLEQSRHILEQPGVTAEIWKIYGLLAEIAELEEQSEVAQDYRRRERESYFGLYREQRQMHLRVAEALATRGQSDALTLTNAEYLHEFDLGEKELREGHLQEAYARYQRLLARIESQSEGNPGDPGSLEHAATLSQLGECLYAKGELSMALQMHQRALALSEVLVERDPESQIALHEQATQLTRLGNILLSLSQYVEAKKASEQASQIYERIDDRRGQAVSRGQLGTIALEQGKYPEARMRHQQTLQTFRALGEPAMEAAAWFQLGRVAQEEENWPEAERCYRECLSIAEQLGDRVGTAKASGALGQVTQETHRFEEAKGWFQHAIWLSQQADPTSGDHGVYLSSLASCLIQEVRTGAVQNVPLQLEQAQQYAEQALAIDQALHRSKLWNRFSFLSDIAEMQGRHDAVRAYHRKEQESFASFADHRYRIDQQFGQLFPALAAAQNDLKVRTQMEKLLSRMEIKGWQVSEALQRIWAGERDWQILAENLDNPSALFILRVLETLAVGADTTTHAHSLVERFSTLPVAIRKALVRGDQQAFQQALEALSAQEQQTVKEFGQAFQQGFEALSAQEQQTVKEFIQALQIQLGDDEEEPS